MDHVEGGGSYRRLLSSLKRITSNQRVSFPSINLYSLWRSNKFCHTSYSYIISDSETSGTRCVPKYTLGKNNPDINVVRCNTTIAMLYLLEIGYLNINLKLIRVIASQLPFIDAIVKVTYYDNDLTNFNVVSGVFNIIGDDNITLQIIPETGYEFKTINLLANSLIKVEMLNISAITNQEINLYNRSYVRITLINGHILVGWYDHSVFYFGLDTIHITRNIVSKIERISVDKQFVDVSSYNNTISNITYLSDGNLITDKVYIADQQRDEVTFIKENNFINNSLKCHMYVVSKHLIFNIVLIRSSLLPKLDNCHCTVRYLDDGIIKELTDYWTSYYYLPHYYIAEQSSIYIIPPLIMAVNQHTID